MDGRWCNAAATDLRVRPDDSLDGTASRYDMRYAMFPIDDTNFDMATPAGNEPARRRGRP